MDEPSRPDFVLVLQGDMLLAAGAPGKFSGAFADLLGGRVSVEGSWPPEHLAAAMRRQLAEQGFFSLFFNTTPLAAYDAALQAGFTRHPHDHGSPPAYLYVFEGAPRFGELVKHPCRLGQGSELLELVRQGISYDEEGYYTRMCLEHGPSFVCEVEGEPVCWSCTHLNGTMGMIYTPPAFRRMGYARSLAAFQIDHMLSLQGHALCHVVEGNTASEQMVLGLGARRDDTAYCWRAAVWPEGMLPLAAASPD